MYFLLDGGIAPQIIYAIAKAYKKRGRKTSGFYKTMRVKLGDLKQYFPIKAEEGIELLEEGLGISEEKKETIGEIADILKKEE